MSEDDEQLELDLLLEAIVRRYGYDFRSYAKASVSRRVRQLAEAEGVAHVADLIPRVLRDSALFERFIAQLSITVTELFRDPSFFGALREHVVPVLRTYPRLRIWVPGCATGQEVYSLAILLDEEGLYDRTRIYATDLNRWALEAAKDGVYSEGDFEAGVENYRKSGGAGDPGVYFHASYERVRASDRLKRNVLFAYHNLVTDGVFSEVHLIVCRNVLIYFDRSLQERVIGLFCDSLCVGGFLAIGPKETLQFTSHAARFDTIAREERIHRLLSLQ